MHIVQSWLAQQVAHLCVISKRQQADLKELDLRNRKLHEPQAALLKDLAIQSPPCSK